MYTSPDRATDQNDADMVCAARVHDYLRGGGHSFSFDRLYAEADPEVAGIVRGILRREHEFLNLAVQFMLDRGIRQFLDLGSGLPAKGGVLDVTAQHCPEARVVHVDTDPAVVEHGRLIVGGQHERAHFLLADATRLDRVLVPAIMEGTLELHRPIGVLAIGLAHLLEPAARALSFLPSYGAMLASGSALAVTHLAPWFAGRLTAEAAPLIAGPGGSVHPRRRRKVALMFEGFDLVEPGIISLSHQWAWGLRAPDPQPENVDTTLLAGLGIKP
ncbi:SAM-dependent methyltransferase [Lentzea sp. BCCO 10_0061]|uniref:SAM-dependent methyltransferase n=1 Tax=Lentzea sokolovensis TaxID=3095429 RepID=A0ABU4VCE5_9PSEU|nr:SAM-dependent methyltransferase [Lentzea sp. BCCO 10_0061]MDX8149483.1 SAM-dependent methyltransferase [Lentzea sp. BCCO 10_0061]